METKQVSRNYSYPIDDVKQASEIILGSLKSDLYGPQILARMASTFATDYETAVTGLVKAFSDQARALGDVHLGTVDLDAALADCALYTGTARNVAKSVFGDQKPLLHDEFAVGQRAPQGLANIIVRAETVHGGCVKFAEEMESGG